MPDDTATTGSGGPMPRLRFPKAARLLRTSDFARVRTSGKPVHGKMVTLGVLKEDSTVNARVGIVTSRRVGSAVIRNRVRRRLREIFRAMRPCLLSGVSVVVVAKPPAASATFAALGEECSKLARRGAILREKAATP